MMERLRLLDAELMRRGRCLAGTRATVRLAADAVDREEKYEKRIGESRKAISLESAFVIPTFSRSGDSGAAAGPRPAEKISSA
jgi:hypothetical protein